MPGKLERGGFGRILAYVWIDGVNVNVEMKYAEKFWEAEKEAREAEKGLWKSKK